MQRVLPARRAALLAATAGAIASTAAVAAGPAASSDGLMQFEHVRVVNAPIQDAATSAAPASSGALRAYVDPATGKLRQPTPEELAQLAAPATTSRLRATAQAQRFIAVEGGGVGVVLDESTMPFAVIHKAADGSLVEACEPGEENAHAVAAKAAASTRAAKGELQ